MKGKTKLGTKSKRNLKVATAIHDFITKNDIAGDTRIYFNGICWNYDSDGKKTILTDIKASDYFEYANDDSVSVSTEGMFYEILNMYWGTGLVDKFNDLLYGLGCYYELGNAWNFTVVWDGDC